ncbi:MAG: hypothetical protein KF688_03875 [Pirellulales bacterium]|nr:hypothetical protein [Pirellulales bacterium]
MIVLGLLLILAVEAAPASAADQQPALQSDSSAERSEAIGTTPAAEEPAAADGAVSGRHPDAVEILHCDFGKSWDVNYDGWPDRWKRHFGPGLPKYVPAALERDDSSTEGSCLTVRLNGGGARLESPAVAVSDNYSYVVETALRMRDVKYGRARIVVEFCDERREVIQTAASAWMTNVPQWQLFHIGPVNPTDPEVALARLVLEIEAGSKVDLAGDVAVDDLWIGRLPKMTVRTNSPFNVYTDPRDVQVVCELSGIRERDPDIIFELLDASDHTLDDNRIQLDGRKITERLSKASDIVNNAVKRPAGYAGTTSWRPPIREHGFYRVRVTMSTARGLLKKDVVSIAVVPPLERPQHGEFGWSLAGDDIPLSFGELGDLLPRVAVHWVKLPVWYGPTEKARGDELVVFAEQLSAQDIEIVGVVDRPPADSELATRVARDAAIADTLSIESSNWLPLLDPVLSRLSLRVRWWQLGNDHDASFSTFPNLEAEIAKLRAKLFRFGQDVSLGIGWRWMQAIGNSTPAPWEFQQYTESPGLTGAELGEYLKLPKRPGVNRWVLVEPLSKRTYDLETRARDLVEQMLAARINGADAVFAARPFDDDRGLMTDSGSPGELLLPWRTTASLLSGAKYLGKMRLPGGSENRLFETPAGDVLMVLWNQSPTDESLYLGERVQVIDVWGRQTTPVKRDERQLLHADVMPSFVIGVHREIALWRMAVKFETQHVPSVFGKTHLNAIEIVNPFPQGVGGYVQIKAPTGWEVSPEKIEFKIGEGHKVVRPFEILLPFDANSGDAHVEANFVVEADRRYEFGVYRTLNVGDGLVECEIHTRLQEDGTLLVEQRMINRGAELVDFKCMLYATGRRRQRAQVFRLGARTDVKIYEYPNGAELLGTEFWLRAEEVNGLRVINRRFLAEQ